MKKELFLAYKFNFLKIHLKTATIVLWVKSYFIRQSQHSWFVLLNLTGYPRYEMELDKKRGIYDITIDKVDLMDAGHYECQATYFRKNGHPVPLKSESAELEVFG